MLELCRRLKVDPGERNREDGIVRLDNGSYDDDLACRGIGRRGSRYASNRRSYPFVVW